MPPARRPSGRARTNPFAAEDTALPGRMLVLLSRLHRGEAPGAQPGVGGGAAPARTAEPGSRDAVRPQGSGLPD
ncbi:hypothetical protein [Methylobacterium crusticola]|nr:hypothetical protein [Methylobacterium crusticola]